jgi:glycosyltransferase involved in cell wall biosynthesis
MEHSEGSQNARGQGEGGGPKATIVLTTHDRRDLLRKAIEAARRQTVPVEIMVMDDNSTDGTAEMMERDFPDISYHRTNRTKGPCFHRNNGIALARTEIVFPLDDDSILQSPETVAQTLREFEDPRIGAVAIPFINLLQTDTITSVAPDRNAQYVTAAFVAASHAVRREAFLKAGGYREVFFYMGEEADLCIRMLDLGLLVRLGCADPIHHYQPKGRISFAADFFGRQNDVLFLVYNAPSRHLSVFLLATTIKGLWFGLRIGRLGTMVRGLFRGYVLAIRERRNRRPVSAVCFRCFRKLKRQGAMRMEECLRQVQGRHDLTTFAQSSVQIAE